MIGKTISHYNILEELGRGGMGVVYKATDLDLERAVAIKFLPQHLSLDSEATQRFINEAKTASTIDHQHIGTIYEIGRTDDGQTFIVMAYYEGETLRERIDRGGMTMEEALDIAIQIASGLAKAHDKDIVHRDIKPSNIIITKDREAKIIDFGLAKLAGKTKLTKEGSTLGTAAYMSPEQARGEEVDHRSDIFSLGSILYEMLAGEPPFKGEHDLAIMYSIINEKHKSLNGGKPSVPIELKKVIDRALAKKADERYKNTDELAQDLKEIESRLGILRQRSSLQSTFLHSWKKLALIGSLIIVALAAALIIPRLFQQEPETIRIAVLPFENLSADESQRYFVDGMTDEIRTRLGEVGARTGKLTVISRTSCSRIKELNLTLPDIARDLNISHVIEGSSQLLGDQVQISVQVTNAHTDEHVWGDIFEGNLADIFSIQRDIAVEVAGTLGQILSPAQAQSIKGAGTDNADAYNLLLMGNHFLRQRLRAGFERAIECAEQALEKDPSYAEAYGMLADAYTFLAIYEFEPWGRMYPKARDNMLRAIGLDDSNVPVQLTQGAIKLWFEWDIDGAEKAFLRALELDPNNAQAHQNYAWLLMLTRRFDEALSHMAVTNELDPLAATSRQDVGECLYFAGRFDESIKATQEAIDFDPNYYQSYIYLALAYIDKGMVAEAEEALKKYKELVPDRAESVAGLILVANAYMDRDKTPEEIIEEVIPESQDGGVSSFTMACLYMIHGDSDRGFEYLEQAFEERVPRLLQIYAHPAFDDVRSDERYLSLIERMGFDK